VFPVSGESEFCFMFQEVKREQNRTEQNREEKRREEKRKKV
jgi:hypothetical protein